MAFYKRVNLVGPAQEKLNGWLSEKYAAIGSFVRLREDDFGRLWTVAEAGDQLVLESQLDQRHMLTAVESEPETPVPQAIVARPDFSKPKGRRGRKAAVSEAILD